MEQNHKQFEQKSTEHHCQHHLILVLDTVEKLMNSPLLLLVFVGAFTFLLLEGKRRAVFVSVVRAAQPNADQVPLNPIEWLEVVQSPILVLVN